MKRLSLLFLVFVLGSCREWKDLQVTSVEGINVSRISVEGIDAGLTLRIKNPNPYGFSLYRSEFDVEYSGIRLGKAVLNKKVRIRANQERTYTFDLKGDFKGVNVLDVVKLLNGASFKNTIEVRGDLRAGTFLVKKRFPVHVSEKLKLN